MAHTSAVGNRKVSITRREQQVLDRIVLGLSNKEIASQLSVAVPTVNQYVHSLLLKLGVENRTQLAIAALGRKDGRFRSSARDGNQKN